MCNSRLLQGAAVDNSDGGGAPPIHWAVEGWEGAGWDEFESWELHYTSFHASR